MVTTFNRANSSVPGPGQGEHYYAYHASGQARLMVHRPASGNFQNAPVLVYLHGGLNHNPGDRSMTPGNAGSKVQQFFSDAYDAGWVIVSIEVPQSGSNSDPFRDMPPVSMWPEPQQYLAAAISYLKQNYTAVAGLDYSTTAATLWGSGNSINPSAIVLHGTSYGGTLALNVALTPDALQPSLPPRTALSTDPTMPRASHRPAAVIALIPQIDWTQFHLDPTNTYGPGAGSSAVYDNDINQVWQRANGAQLWSTTPLEQKAGGGCWALLEKGYTENKYMPIACSWGTVSTTGNSALTWEDWAPWSVRDDIANNKAFLDPHHHFQARPFGDKLYEVGDRRSAIHWGTSAAGNNDDGGFLNQGVSIDDDTEYSKFYLDWLHGLGIGV